MQKTALSEIKKMIRIYNRKPNDIVTSLALDENSGEVIKIKADGSRHSMSQALFITFYFHNLREGKLTAMLVSDAQALIDKRNAISSVEAKYHLDILNGTVVENLDGRETALPVKNFVRLFSSSN